MRFFKSFLMAILFSLLYFNLSNFVLAAPQEISAEGQYRLGDNDSRDTGKKAALADAKRKIIEQAGILVESYTEVNDFHVNKDQIKTTAKSMIKIKSEEVEFSENGTLCTAFVVAIIDTDNISNVLESEIKKSKDTSKVEVSNIKSGSAYIPKNTEILAEIMGTFSSKDTKKGDKLPFRLVKDLIINDVVVAKVGTEVKGICSFRRKANMLGGGSLKIQLLSFKTINGVDVPLKTSRLVASTDDRFGTVMDVIMFKNMIVTEGTRFRAKVSDDINLNVTWSELSELEEDI